jgi:hypothetical protein
LDGQRTTERNSSTGKIPYGILEHDFHAILSIHTQRRCQMASVRQRSRIKQSRSACVGTRASQISPVDEISQTWQCTFPMSTPIEFMTGSSLRHVAPGIILS